FACNLIDRRPMDGARLPMKMNLRRFRATLILPAVYILDLLAIALFLLIRGRSNTDHALGVGLLVDVSLPACLLVWYLAAIFPFEFTLSGCLVAAFFQYLVIGYIIDWLLRRITLRSGRPLTDHIPEHRSKEARSIAPDKE